MSDKIAHVLTLIKTLKKKGFEAYVAGGAVRDHINGNPISDYDIVTNARPEKIKSIFRHKRAYIAGKAFPVCYIGPIEIATYRDKNGEFSDNLAEDLKRRDLTMNSMAMDLQTGKIIDLYGGRKDLKKRIIRFTENPDKRILEDPLRIIRACRFLAKYKGRFSEGSKTAIEKYRIEVKKMPPERIKIELIKAMKVKKPGLFFETLKDFEILKEILPSLDQLHDLDGGPYHNETVFEHSMLVGNSMPPENPLLRLTSYLHDTGKKEAFKILDGKPVFHGHENMTDMLAKDLKKLKFSNFEQDFILNHTHMHMRSLGEETTPKTVRKILADLSARDISWHNYLLMKTADRKGNRKKQPYTFSELKIKVRKIKDEIERSQKPTLSIRDLDISGHDLMKVLHIRKGPVVGNVLERLFELVLEDPDLNTRERLLDLAAGFMERRHNINPDRHI